VTNVKEDEQFYRNEQKEFGRNDRFVSTLNEAMKGSKDLPVSVQVITMPF
jgi:hypothetical protein